MRRLIRQLMAFIAAAVVAYAYVEGGARAAQTAAALAVALWMVATILRWLWSRHRRRTPRALIARPSCSSPWGRRDQDVSGCFARLDPAWRQWLEPEPKMTAKGIRHG